MIVSGVTESRSREADVPDEGQVINNQQIHVPRSCISDGAFLDLGCGLKSGK